MPSWNLFKTHIKDGRMVAWLRTSGSHWFPGHVSSVHVACIRGVPFMLILVAKNVCFLYLEKKPSEIWQIRHFRSCSRSKTSSFSLLCFLIRLYLPELLISNISKDEFVTSLFHNRKLVELKWCKTILIILWTTSCTFLFLTCLSLNSVIQCLFSYRIKR